MQPKEMEFPVAIGYCILCFALVAWMLKGYVPAVGESILLREAFILVIQYIIAITLFYLGVKNPHYIAEAKEDMRGVLRVMLFLLSGLTLWLSVGQTKDLVKDFDAAPQEFMLELCTYDEMNHRRGPNSYYLEGTCNGEEYSFDVTGTDTTLLKEIETNNYNVCVTAYPNTKAVVRFEVYRTLEEFSNSISVARLEQEQDYPTKDEFKGDRIILLAKDEAADVALYGVHMGKEIECIACVGDEKISTGIHWWNDEAILPDLVCQDIDDDGETEIMIVTHDCYINTFGSEDEFYIIDYYNGQWNISSVEDSWCFDAVKDIIDSKVWDARYISVYVGDLDFGYGDFTEEEWENYGTGESAFYPTAIINFWVTDRITMACTPVYITAVGREMKFRKIGFELNYHDGVFQLGDYHAIEETEE